MEVEKKVWPEYFELIIQGKKNIELRLADFELNEGDILILREYDPRTNSYTGRAEKKRVRNLIKFNPFDAYTTAEIKKFGFYEIELKKV